ncbi:MAG TPA: hypothetical protein VGE45_18720 [Chloroflexia bacterium]|jgi:Lhr-like helicase
MEIIRESSLGDEAREALKRAQDTRQLVEITNEQGQVIARLIPAHYPANSTAHNRARTELDKLINAISTHLPEQVDAVEVIRDVRR